MEEKRDASRFFQNRECRFFPCHKGVAEEEFNCLFCYCPLYALGDRCGGNFRYTDSGVKDCTNCSFPHRRENYRAVLKRFPEISALAGKPSPDAPAARQSENAGGKTGAADRNAGGSEGGLS